MDTKEIMVNAIQKLLKDSGQQMIDNDNKELINSDKKVTEGRIQGKIIKVDLEKGFGFISSQQIKFRRIFFHWSSLVQDTKTFENLKVGMEVEFEAKFKDDKGWRAIQIKVVE